MQRLVVHPADHEHLAGVVLLDDGADQAVGVALEAAPRPAGRGRPRRGRSAACVTRPILPPAGAASRRSVGPLLGGPAGVQAPVDAAERCTSSRCGPTSTTSPASTTSTWSAASAVESRCAIATDVRPRVSALQGALRAAPRWRGRPRTWPRRAPAGRGRRGRRGRAPPAGAPRPTAPRRAARPAVSRPCGSRSAHSSRPSSVSASTTSSRRTCAVPGACRTARCWRAACRRTRKPSCGTSTTRSRSDEKRTSRRSTPSTSTRPPAGSISRVSSLAKRGLARAGLADDGDPGPRRRARGRRRAARGAARVGERDVLERARRSARAAAPRPRRPGRRRRPGCRGRASTRRQPATAFCSSLSTSVPICTGPVNSWTRNRKATQLAEGEAAVRRPSQVPTHDDDRRWPGPRPGRRSLNDERHRSSAPGSAPRAWACDGGVDPALGALLDGVGPDRGGADDRLGHGAEHVADPLAHRRVGRGDRAAGSTRSPRNSGRKHSHTSRASGQE